VLRRHVAVVAGKGFTRLTQVSASPCPVLDYRALFKTVLIDRQLNNFSQTTLIMFIDLNEPERLQDGGDRRQHFCSANHRPHICQEHQLDVRALIQRAGQAEQSAGDGNDLQLASNAASALGTKDGRSCVRKLQPRRSRISFGL
jgi:hypothetical protein